MTRNNLQRVLLDLLFQKRNRNRNLLPLLGNAKRSLTKMVNRNRNARDEVVLRCESLLAHPLLRITEFDGFLLVS